MEIMVLCVYIYITQVTLALHDHVDTCMVFLMFQCMGNLVPHTNPMSIECCDNTDKCNYDLKPQYTERATTPSSGKSIVNLLCNYCTLPA